MGMATKMEPLPGETYGYIKIRGRAYRILWRLLEPLRWLLRQKQI